MISIEKKIHQKVERNSEAEMWCGKAARKRSKWLPGARYSRSACGTGGRHRSGPNGCLERATRDLLVVRAGGTEAVQMGAWSALLAICLWYGRAARKRSKWVPGARYSRSACGTGGRHGSGPNGCLERATRDLLVVRAGGTEAVQMGAWSALLAICLWY